MVVKYSSCSHTSSNNGCDDNKEIEAVLSSNLSQDAYEIHF